jgi:TonB family protein
MFALMTLVPLFFCLVLDFIPVARAQSEKHSSRKVIRTQTPEYPAVLKNKGIGGVVRLNARVLSDGTVAHVGILGDNPILAECATQAVMQWKYAPAASATNEVVVLDFGPHH